MDLLIRTMYGNRSDFCTPPYPFKYYVVVFSRCTDFEILPHACWKPATPKNEPHAQLQIHTSFKFPKPHEIIDAPLL